MAVSVISTIKRCVISRRLPVRRWSAKAHSLSLAVNPETLTDNRRRGCLVEKRHRELQRVQVDLARHAELLSDVDELTSRGDRSVWARLPHAKQTLVHGRLYRYRPR